MLAYAMAQPVGGLAFQRRPEADVVASDLSIFGVITPQQFGSAGKPDVDSSDALDAMAQHINARPAETASIFLPPGIYHYRGKGLHLVVKAITIFAIPATVEILLAEGVPFLTLGGFLSQTHISGIRFNGGGSIITLTNTLQNVSGRHVFEDLEFFNYTKCALSNNSIDQPYINISRCVFHASSKSKTIGLAIGGYLDMLYVESCSFQKNSIHMKLGPRLGGSIQIFNSDFLQFDDEPRYADVWIAPARGEGWNNSGGGLEFSGCKFGNENQLLDQSRILLAAEQVTSGKLRGEVFPDFSWISGWETCISGLTIRGCRIASVGGCRASFISSFISHIDRIIFTDNICEDRYPILCGFQIPDDKLITPLPKLRWTVRLAPGHPGLRSFGKVSNRTVDLDLHDPWHELD